MPARTAAPRGRGVDAAAVTRDDAVELGERLHLVDDHAPHLRGALRGFRGQLQHAAAQLLAGELELALHVRRHPAHALHDVGEALGRLLEHLVGFVRGLLEQTLAVVGHLLVDAAQCFERQLALLVGRGADAAVLIGDRPGALRGRFGDQPRDVAGAVLGDVEGLLEHPGKALEPRVEVVAALVEHGDHALERRLAVGHRGEALPVALLDRRDRLGERVAVVLELHREVAEVAQDLGGHPVERADVLVHLAGGRVGVLQDIADRRDELGDPRREDVLDRVEVGVGAAEDLLEEAVGIAQPLEQRRGVGAHRAVGFEQLGHRGDGGLLQFRHRARGRLLQVAERLRDQRGRLRHRIPGAVLQFLEGAVDERGRGRARLVDDAGELAAVVHHRLAEGERLGVDRLHRAFCGPLDLHRELTALGGDRGDQPAALLIEQAGELGRIAVHRC